MKKKIWLCISLCLCLLLAGCSKTEQGTETGEASQGSWDWESYNLTLMHLGGMLETPESYYVLANLEEGNFIYVSDKENMGWLPLCSRPDCSHDDENCNAYVEITTSIGLYKENIYYTYNGFDGDRSTVELWKMDLSGENHQKVKEVPLIEGSSSDVISGYSGYFHKGYYLYSVDTGQGEDERGEVRALPLEQDQEGYQVIASFQEPLGHVLFHPKGEIVYAELGYEDRIELIKYDLEKQEILGEKKDWLHGSMTALPGDTITVIWDTIGVYNYNLEDGTETKLFDWQLDGDESMYTDGTYYYCGRINEFVAYEKEPGGGFRILDQEGKLVQEIEMPQDAIVYYYGITSEYIWFYEGQLGYMGTPMWYLEKDKIGTNELEWHYVGE